MQEFGYVAGGSPAFSADLAVNLTRVKNGYVLAITKIPEPAPEEAPVAPVSDGVDDLIDAMKCVINALHENGDDGWKGSENKEKIRRGFRALFPQAAAVSMKYPETHQLVFGSKKELLAFLEKNL